MKLYHGSNVMIEKVDFAKCHPFKDFGCGFYLTDNIAHARNMAFRRCHGRDYIFYHLFAMIDFRSESNRDISFESVSHSIDGIANRW